MRTIFIACGALAPILAFESPKDADQYTESASKGCGIDDIKAIEVPVVSAGATVSMRNLNGYMETVRRVPLDQVEEVEMW